MTKMPIRGQLIALVLEKGDFEFYLTIIALPLSMLLVFEGHLAARHESRWMMVIFGFGCLAAMVYFVYKVKFIHRRRPFHHAYSDGLT